MENITLCPSCQKGDHYGHQHDFLDEESRVTLCHCSETEHHGKRRSARTPQVHYFTDSGTAYDESQWRDDIKDGDVLVVDYRSALFERFGRMHEDGEKSVAVLIGAWPTVIDECQSYVTDVDGAFHSPEPGATFDDVVVGHCVWLRSSRVLPVDRPASFYVESKRIAQQEWKKLTLAAREVEDRTS